MCVNHQTTNDVTACMGGSFGPVLSLAQISFPIFKLIIIHFKMTQIQTKIKFEPTRKLNRNIIIQKIQFTFASHRCQPGQCK